MLPIFLISIPPVWVPDFLFLLENTTSFSVGQAKLSLFKKDFLRGGGFADQDGMIPCGQSDFWFLNIWGWFCD